MRLAVVWGGISLAFLSLAVWSWLAATTIGWLVALAEGIAGMTGATLALLYVCRAGGRPVETWLGRSGGWGLSLTLLLLPYRILAWLTLLTESQIRREPPLAEVAPGLFLGRRPFGWEGRTLRARGIETILDLCAELPSRLDHGPAASRTERCPILDGTPPTVAQLQFAVDWATAPIAQGRPTLIHCAQGHGRSATVAAVVLVRAGLVSDLDAALTCIEQRRPGARPSEGQRRAAITFLRGSVADRALGES